MPSNKDNQIDLMKQHESRPLDSNDSIKHGLGNSFQKRRGFKFKLPNNEVCIFIRDDFDPKNAKQASDPIAHVRFSPANYKWVVHSEPTGDSRMGISVQTPSGKTIASGEVFFDNGQLQFMCQTLYPGITNAMALNWKVEGSCKTDGSCSVTASVGGTC